MTLRLIILFALVCAGGCISTQPSDDLASDVIAADGVFVHHLRLRVVPEQTKQFEKILTECVRVAEATRVEGGVEEWLVYREPPGRYWLITFSETVDGFRYPDGLAPFVKYIADRSSNEGSDLLLDVEQLDHVVDWEIVIQQRSAWSTTDNVDPSVHPKARMMMRTIKPGMQVRFATALARRTEFLSSHAYPLPIEGFVTRRGDPSLALQVVFPTDWPAFHATESFGAFVKRLPRAEQDDYAERKAALMRTMSDAAWYDGSFAKELSFTD